MSAVSFTAWPRDSAGRLLPAAPLRGLVLEVSGRGLAHDRFRVTHVDAVRFRVSGAAPAHDRPLESWGAYLDGLLSVPGATLTVHLPSCGRTAWPTCQGCDGSAVGRPGAVAGQPTASPTPHPSPGSSMASVPLAQRDARLLRAARDVLQRYRFVELGPGQLRVEGGSRDYVLQLSLDGSEAPRCSCPDNRRTEIGGFCKHAIAGLLREPSLRYQLLELFL
jgi:hypothetical protein